MLLCVVLSGGVLFPQTPVAVLEEGLISGQRARVSSAGARFL